MPSFLPNKDDVMNHVLKAPVTGMATVTAIAAEIFAGASRLQGRRRMIIKNEHPSLRLRIGGTGVTQLNGFPIEPGAALELSFDPEEDTLVYAISEGEQMEVSVIEW